MSDEFESSVISPALRDFFENRKGELARVLIAFKSNLQISDLVGDFDHDAVIEYVEKSSFSSQVGFLDWLGETDYHSVAKAGQTFFENEEDIIPIPLANSLIVTVDNQLVDTLEQRDEIAFVSLLSGITRREKANFFPHTVRPLNVEFDCFNLPKKGAFNHVEYLFAHRVWAAGYTGEGVVCAVIDDGVDFNHSKLKSKAFSEIHTDVSGTHGTSCASIIAAGSVKDEFPIGIAPDAKIIDIKVDTSWALEALIGFCKATRISEVDVISMSLEYFPIQAEAFPFRINGSICEYNDPNPRSWRHACYVAGLARKLHVVAAGNMGQLCNDIARPEFNVPNNVALPGSCPSPLQSFENDEDLLSSAITIGATDCFNKAENEIADKLRSISSVGPVEWDDEWQLIKPDLCAPGDKIVTALSSSYDNYKCFSDTSAATAVVAGALCLFVQARRTAETATFRDSPLVFQEILEEGCIPIFASDTPHNCIYGDSVANQKVNGYGAGRLDIFKAYTCGKNKGLWIDAIKPEERNNGAFWIPSL